jgi:hypothetical protein
MRSSLASVLLLMSLPACSSSSLGDGPGEADATIEEGLPDATVADPPDAEPPLPDALVLPACTEGAMRLLGGPDNHCYMLFTGALQYTQARDACAALVPPAHLVVSTSQEENDYFAPLVNRVPPDHLMGGNDLTTEGTFLWITGEPMTYVHWRTTPVAEPNDGGDGPGGVAEDCMIVEGDTGATWDDRPCTTAFPYVCERE